jgi:hypothetical protein
VTANAALLLFLIGFWGLFAAAVKAGNWWAGKRWSDGPSLIPVIPVLPVVAGAVGWLVNLVASPWGSWGVAGLHVGWLVVSLVLIWLHPAPAQGAEAEPGAAPDRRGM